MDFNDIAPIQLLALGFGPDNDYEDLVLDEIARLTGQGLIRLVDLRFVAKDDDGTLVALEFSGLDDEDAAEFGVVIDSLIGLGAGSPHELFVLDGCPDRSFGLGPNELTALAQDLDPGDAVALLLFEHIWAAELKAAISLIGGFPIAEGFLTSEALLMVGAEVKAIADAHAGIELADAVSGAAMLESLATVADDIKSAVAVDAVRALMVAGLIADAAAEEALDALVAAELVEKTAIYEAAAVVAESVQEADAAFEAFAAAATET